MKNILLLLLLFFISISRVKAQDSLRISSHLDSLPRITIKKDIPLLILGIGLGAFTLGASCNYYTIGKKEYQNPRPMKPYFDKLGDSEVINDYQQHRNLKPIYFSGYGAGMLLFIYAVNKEFKSSFAAFATGLFGGQPPPKSTQGQTEIYAGLGIMLAATVVRINSFSNLHKATNRYNELISKPKTAFDIRPNQEGLGLGLRMSF